MIGAIKQSNGKYKLIDITYHLKSISTYSRRKQIKELGGVWNSKEKSWIDFPEEGLKEILASKRLKIRTAPYPGVDKSEDSYCFEYEIQNNQIRRLTWSDDREWVNIEQIYGEE